jgi:hypothetical protein
MQAVRGMCTRVVQLAEGRVVDSGPPARIVDAYLKVQAGAEGVMEWQGDDRYGDDDVKLDAVRILGTDGLPTPVVVSSEPFRVQMDIDVGRVPEGLTIGIDLALADGTIVFRSYQTDPDPAEWPEIVVGRNRLECLVEGNLLNAGRYSVHPRISIDRVRWIVHCGGVSFEVHRDPGTSINALVERPGAVAPLITWWRADGVD